MHENRSTRYSISESAREELSLTSRYDIVIAGGGHNSLIAAAYLAKAGFSVCIVERNSKVGGSVATSELTGPGFRQDVCSTAHAKIISSPLIRNDELELISRFGLRYVHPEEMSAILFDDGSTLEFWSDLDRTCASIAQFSMADANRFRSFCASVDHGLDMITMAMDSVPSTAGMHAMLMDQSPEGQEMMRLQAISAWDLICEWFDHPKVRIALARHAAEAMLDPFANGTGFGFYVILPYMYRHGIGVCVGGSGALAESLEQCVRAHGGTIRLEEEVVGIAIEAGCAIGLELSTGEVVNAEKAVIAGLHVAQVFPHMVRNVELPPGFQHRIDVLKHSDYQAMTVHLALNEPLRFRAGEHIEQFYWIKRCQSDPDAFRASFQNLRKGIPDRSHAFWTQQFRADPSRVPPGKAQMHIYAFMPIDLKDGGRERWDEIGAGVAKRFIDDLRAECLNLTPENIIQTHFMTPLDFMRYNHALVDGDILQFGVHSWQVGGNRPVPGWSQYRMPVERLYLTGASSHPGGGVTGGSGRNTAQVVMEDLGLDFERAVA